MKKYIDIRVSGHDEELKAFLTLVELIQSFGAYGMSRTIEVHVDGDGSGRLDFRTKMDDDTLELLPNFKLNDLHELEEATDKYKLDIGE
jgi:hypothetical protein